MNLNLSDCNLPREYFYSCLPLCVIDAVFSLNAVYTSTQNTVNNFCRFFNVKKESSNRSSDITQQLSVNEFLQLYENYGSERMSREIYINRQRTSPRNGILKAEAVQRFSRVLANFSVNYFSDLAHIIPDPGFESAIKDIPGQRSGLTLNYFFMLAGFDDLVKPDRWIMDFVTERLERNPSLLEAQEYLAVICEYLQSKYPLLTPRILDYKIWNFMRERGKKKVGVFTPPN